MAIIFDLKQSSKMKEFQTFLLFLSVRILSVIFVQTWYVPDEYWQSTEVAHRMSFGYGTLTWEWISGIRSYFYPFLITILYKLLELIRLDYAEVLIFTPRIFQAILSAYADFRFYKWTGDHKWAAFSIMVSWFWFYTCSRTLLNTLETSLTTIALSYYPWYYNNRTENGRKYLCIVALLCAIRPTAVIPWFPLCVYHIITAKENRKDVILKEFLPIGSIALALSVLLDSVCHGEFVVTSWQFLKLNVISNIGSWYGTHPWYWYFTSGLPVILGIHILPFGVGVVQSLKNRQIYKTNVILLISITFTVLIYSMLPHKEFRFILSLLPMALYISSDVLTRWSYKANNSILWCVAMVLLVSNAIPAYYLGMVHQRGTLDAMVPLAEIAKQKPYDTYFLFLMPCHSTPLYSHLHANVTTKFLSCEPNLTNEENYKSEAEMFYEKPNTWLSEHYPAIGTLPSHIITFDTLVPAISSILTRYKPIHRFYHTSYPVGARDGYYVIVHERVD